MSVSIKAACFPRCVCLHDCCSSVRPYVCFRAIIFKVRCLFLMYVSCLVCVLYAYILVVGRLDFQINRIVCAGKQVNRASLLLTSCRDYASSTVAALAQGSTVIVSDLSRDEKVLYVDSGMPSRSTLP